MGRGSMINHDKPLSTVDLMDKMDQMDKEKNSTSNQKSSKILSMESMNALYGKLYKAPYYEVGFHDNGEFRRRIVKKSIELCRWVTRLKDKYPLFILSHGYNNARDARLLNTETFITNKIFLDFDGEDLEKVKDEVDHFLISFQRRYGGRLYLQFSGGKGYHVYILLPETMELSLNELQVLLKHIKLSFNLQYLDDSVISNPLRLARAPCSYHENGNYVEPLVLDPEPSPGLNMLVKGVRKKAMEDELYKKNMQLVKEEARKNESKNGNDEIKNWNVVDKIVQKYFETGKHVHGTKHIVCCPFHSDSHPSAFYDDKVFHCSACAITVGSYRLLTEYMGKSKGESLDVIKGFQ